MMSCPSRCRSRASSRSSRAPPPRTPRSASWPSTPTFTCRSRCSAPRWPPCAAATRFSPVHVPAIERPATAHARACMHRPICRRAARTCGSTSRGGTPTARRCSRRSRPPACCSRRAGHSAPRAARMRGCASPASPRSASTRSSIGSTGCWPRYDPRPHPPGAGRAVIPRDVCEQAYRAAVAACDPDRLVRRAVARIPPQRAMLGVSVGKAALAMARGAGPVVRGIAVAPQLDGKPLPLGWSARDGGHPFVDERSLAAGEAVRDLVYGTGFDDLMLVLISGGASSLIEVLQGDYTLDEYRARIEAALRSGMPIDELNQLRSSMSSLKAGRLATYSKAPVITLAVSDVIGDAISVIGSG